MQQLTRYDARLGSVAPTSAAERVLSLDVLRGVAIAGILVMNVYVFAMPMPAYSNPRVWGGAEVHNIGTWFVTHALFDQKFLSIFAMLFGAGIVLMTGRVEQQSKRSRRIFLRRQLWLMVIGCLHAYLIWHGDILFGYAIAGLVAYLFRYQSPRRLIAIACLLLSVTLALGIGFSYKAEQLGERAAEIEAGRQAGEDLADDDAAVLERWATTRDMYQPTAESLQQDLQAYCGSYLEILQHRAPTAALFQQGAVFIFGWRFVALMLIGMALFRIGVLSAERSVDFYRKLMTACYALGLPLTVFSGINLHLHDFDGLYASRVGGLPNYFGSIVVALGHISLIMLIVRAGFLQRTMQRFAAVGRMALTNYLMHSLILTTIFYGYGLGLYGQVPRFWQMGFVVAVLSLQLALSPWWLARYRFGPAEWLWRSLTYRKRQPMRVIRPG